MNYKIIFTDQELDLLEKILGSMLVSHMAKVEDEPIVSKIIHKLGFEYEEIDA